MQSLLDQSSKNLHCFSFSSPPSCLSTAAEIIITQSYEISALSIQSVVKLTLIIVIIITSFQEDNIFGTNASLIYGPQIQMHDNYKTIEIIYCI